MSNSGTTMVLIVLVAGLLTFFFGKWYFAPVPETTTIVYEEAEPLLEESDGPDIQIAKTPITPELISLQKELRNISFETGSVGDKLLNFMLSGKQNFRRERYEIKNNSFLKSEKKLSPELLIELEQLAAILKAYPDLIIEIVSHTDYRGAWEAQQERTNKRAILLRTQLVNELDAPENQVFAKGEGSTYLIADGDSERAQQLNERIEIKIKGI